MKVIAIGRPSPEFESLTAHLFTRQMLAKAICMKFPSDKSIADYLRTLLLKIRGHATSDSNIRNAYKLTPSVLLLRAVIRRLMLLSSHARSLEISNSLSDRWFSTLAASTIKKQEVNTIYAWSPYSFRSFEFMSRKRPEIKLVLEMYMPHADYVNDIYSRFFTRDKRSFFPPEGRGRLVTKECKLADRIIVPSEFVKTSLETIDSSLLEKVIVIPFGCDGTNQFPKEKSSDFFSLERLKVLFVGTICYEKGFDILQQACANLNEQGVQVELTAAGNIGVGYRERFNAISKYVNYLGRVPHSKLNDIYNSSHVLALPSFSEGSPLVTYEALASGLPCIVSENANSIVTHGSDGYIVKVGSVTAVMEAIKQVYLDRSWLSLASKRARDKALSYLWERRNQRIVEILSALENPVRVT